MISQAPNPWLHFKKAQNTPGTTAPRTEYSQWIQSVLSFPSLQMGCLTLASAKFPMSLSSQQISYKGRKTKPETYHVFLEKW